MKKAIQTITEKYGDLTSVITCLEESALEPLYNSIKPSETIDFGKLSSARKEVLKRLILLYKVPKEIADNIVNIYIEETFVSNKVRPTLLKRTLVFSLVMLLVMIAEAFLITHFTS